MNMDDFFSFVSKAVIIIPIFVLIVSLFIKFNTPKKITLLTPTPMIIPTIKSEFKFDLKGPIICNNLFIKDKKVLLKNKLINYLLNGDCLYIWEEKKTNGEKKCGLTNYVNLAENYLGLLNINDLINNNLIKGFIKDRDIDLTSIIKSCKKEKIKNDSIFKIPGKIVFKLLNG